jgi:hypothetical protein
MIAYVNKVLAESDGLTPIRLNLCQDSGVREHVRWKNMTLRAQQDAFNSVLEHFRSHGYSVRTFSEDDLIEVSHNYPEIHSKDKITTMADQANVDKMKNDMPAAISMAINIANTAIEKAAKHGRYRCVVDLKDGATYRDTLTWSDRVNVFNHVFTMLESEGYYIHRNAEYNRATVIWGEEAENEWQVNHNPTPAPVQEKKGLFSRKKKGE